MPNRKPESLVLFVALFSTLTVLAAFLIDLALTRYRDIEVGEYRLQNFGIMMAEHTARSFEAIDVLLREISSGLSSNHNNWESWEESDGWEYIARHHSRAMPQLHALIVFDRYGNQRFVSTDFPAPHINVKDRPYFTALENGAEAVTYGPYIGRNTSRYTYALARRIVNDKWLFSGVAYAEIEPAYLQNFCWANRLSDDFETVLINAKEEIIGSCRPINGDNVSSPLGSIASETLFDGALRNLVLQNGLSRHNGILISTSSVPGYPDLKILAAMPESTLLENWVGRLIEIGTLGFLVTIVLLVGAFMIRRQFREMAKMTEQLSASHENLEERIHVATQALAKQKDDAEKANIAKSRFLAAASHDLRQPLHALSLFAADLQRQVRSDTLYDLPRLSEQISASVAVLGHLLDTLLDISRLDVDDIRPDIKDFSLAATFNRLNDSFRRAAIDRDITLRFRPTDYWLSSDPAMIERMIANLISNALNYTPIGGCILVAARLRNQGKDIQIEVRDNGIGIPLEHQAAIFAEFYQIGNPARESGKGLGLGLSIIDRLARILNIKVTLRSEPNAGSTFALSVPKSHANDIKETDTLSHPLGRVHIIGESKALQRCFELIKGWNYVTSTQTCLNEDGALPNYTMLITDSEHINKVLQKLPPESPLILISSGNEENLPENIHILPLPVRPAKLRALLDQLQKALPRSIP